MNLATSKPSARARQLAALWISRHLADEAGFARDVHPAELADVRRELEALAHALDLEAARLDAEPEVKPR